MLNRELIHKTIYSSADLNLQIPDVDQMAEFLFKAIQPQETSLSTFKVEFIKKIGDEYILQKSLYAGIIDQFTALREQLAQKNKQLLLCSWTQGNIYLQTQKALVFQHLLPSSLLTNPSIYASLNKMQLLPLAYQDLKKQDCDLICVIDDRLSNVLEAHRTLIAEQSHCLFIHKIRPDKVITHRLKHKEERIIECKEWAEVNRLLTEYKANKIGLVLDKDGIVFNTTIYRQLLEEALLNWKVSK